MTTAFQLLQDDWLQIAPLGDHPHQLGIQRIDAEAVAAMANRFNTFSARLGRLFSGVPLFEGHHDTDPEKYPNGKSFAWVMELQNRADQGLWGRLTWTDEGRALVTSGNYKFISPVWNAREIARVNGRPIFRPENLLSLALTNLPNLPLPPLANEQNHMTTITQLLELPTDATPDQICEAVTILKNSTARPSQAAADSLLIARCSELENELSTLQNSHASVLSTQSSELATARENFNRERTARIELVLANAIASGRLTAAERAQWHADLTADFETKHAALAALSPKLNTTSITRDLGNQKTAYDTEAQRRSALAAYLAQQGATGLDYDTAWQNAKIDRADLFTQMRPR